MDVILPARDLRLYTAITDCGAGGLSSAVGEMASRIGADVDLTELSRATTLDFVAAARKKLS